MSDTTRRFSKSRRVALAGGAAIVLGSAAARAVAAQQAALPFDQTAKPAEGDVFFFANGAPIELEKRRDEWLKAVANKLGVTSDRLQTAMQDATKEVGFPGPLLPPVAIAGTLPPGAFKVHIDSGVAAAARALGLSEEQLRKEWPAKSLTDVAKAHNVDPKVVAEAIKAQRRADLDKAVAEGTLPANAAAKLKSHLDQEMEHFMQLSGSGGDKPFSIRLEHSVSIKEP
jgi:transposase-like protein